MGQTRNNNLSPLPFYRAVAEQECRLPWAFGDVFPLRCDNRLLPFLIVRPKTTTYGAGDEAIAMGGVNDGLYYDDGTTMSLENGMAIYDIPEHTGVLVLYLQNVPTPRVIGGKQTSSIVIQDNEGNVLQQSDEEGDFAYPIAADNAASIWIQTDWNLNEMGEVDTPKVRLSVAKSVPTPVRDAYLHDCEGNTTDILSKFTDSIKVVNVGDSDVIFYDGTATPLEGIAAGTYWLQLTSGDVWYSEMFTYGAVPNVRLEWNDVSDLSLPDGKIPYSRGYVNRVWLNTAVGRPEYEIEKEGDERDGYFFMEKGISRKSYRMTFFAPEYLCDALRLVPVSDVVKIWDTSRGASVEYDVDDVDMEVEWLEQGNYASVTITFHTDTVVKNLGKII